MRKMILSSLAFLALAACKEDEDLSSVRPAQIQIEQATHHIRDLCAANGLNAYDCDEIMPEVTEEFDDMQAYRSRAACEMDYGYQCETDSMGWFVPAMSLFLAAEVFDEIGDLKKERKKAYQKPLTGMKSSVPGYKSPSSTAAGRKMTSGAKAQNAPLTNAPTKSPVSLTKVPPVKNGTGTHAAGASTTAPASIPTGTTIGSPVKSGAKAVTKAPTKAPVTLKKPTVDKKPAVKKPVLKKKPVYKKTKTKPRR